MNVPNILGSTKQEFLKGNLSNSIGLLEETLIRTDTRQHYSMNERDLNYWIYELVTDIEFTS